MSLQRHVSEAYAADTDACRMQLAPPMLTIVRDAMTTAADTVALALLNAVWEATKAPPPPAAPLGPPSPQPEQSLIAKIMPV